MYPGSPSWTPSASLNWSEPQRPSLSAAVRPSSAVHSTLDHTPTRHPEIHGGAAGGGVVDVISPMRCKFLSPGWYDPISPSSQTGVMDSTGNVLSPSSSIGSGMRIPTLAPPLPPASHVSAVPIAPSQPLPSASSHVCVPSFQWTPPRPQLRAPHPQYPQYPQVPPPVRTSSLASVEGVDPGSTSPHTPRGQRVEVGVHVVAPSALSPALRPPPAWSPPIRHQLHGGRPASVLGLMPPPALTAATRAPPSAAPLMVFAPSIGTTSTTTSTVMHTHVDMHDSPSQRPRPPPTYAPTSPPFSWTPPHLARMASGLSPLAARTGASGPLMRTPVRGLSVCVDEVGAAREDAAPSTTVVVAPAAARTPRHRAQTIAFSATTPQIRRGSGDATAAAAASGDARVPDVCGAGTRVDEEDDDDDDEYAVAIDDDGSILSNKDVRQRQQYHPPTPPFAAGSSSSTRSPYMTASPFVPFRSPVVVARPLFKTGESGEEDSFVDAHTPSFLAHMDALTGARPYEEESERSCYTNESSQSQRPDDSTSRAELTKAAQWVDLLLLFRDRENDKPVKRVKAALAVFDGEPDTTSSARAREAHANEKEEGDNNNNDSEDEDDDEGVAAAAHRPTASAHSAHVPVSPFHPTLRKQSGQSQATEIELATFHCVWQRRMDRDQRVVEALDAESFSHPLLHVR